MRTIETVKVASGLSPDVSFAPPTLEIIQIDPEDTADLLREAIGKHGGPLIFLVPQWGQLAQGTDFARLSEATSAPQRISFVIPPSRFEVLSTIASRAGFQVFPSLDVALHQLVQGHVPASSAATTIPPQVLPPPPPPLARASTRWPGRKQLAAIALLLLLLLGGLAELLATVQVPTAPFIVGNFAFLSSGRLDPTSLKGLNDLVAVELHGIGTPAAGEALYAWLQPDAGQDSIKPLLLGKLQVTAGSARLTYADPGQSDLLVSFSRFLVTQQDAGQTPVTPPLDPATHRYQGAIPSVPTSGDEKHFSLLSHLRHLLASDPTVESIGLAGGLNVWLFRNSQAVLEEATTARDYWEHGATAYMRRQITRILDYLDGYNYVWHDVPAGVPFMIDRQAGELGLLTFDPQQTPPGYIAHVSLHLDGLANSPGATADQQALALRLDKALAQVAWSYAQVRRLAAQLVRMNDAQLRGAGALSLLNDMATDAQTAFAPGPFGEPAGGGELGVAQILTLMEGLAVVPVVELS